MMKKISVIVPVYKVEDYLATCVESIINQTYRNLEIILVDDGSPDACPQMCDEFARADERIKVVHKKNGGLSDARNAGFKVATGDYIGYVDSDDYIDSDMFSSLLDGIEKNGADICCCRYSKVFPDGNIQDIGDGAELTLTGNDGLKEYLLGKIVDPFVCNKLYSRKIIGDLRFVKGVVGEDNEFNYAAFLRAKKVFLCQKPFYKYRQERPGAITNKGNVSKKSIESIYNWDKIHKACKKDAPSLEMYAIRRRAYFYIGAYNKIILSKKDDFSNDKINILKFLKDYKKAIRKSDICERSLKVATLLITSCRPLYVFVMRVYKKTVGTAEI